MNIFVLDTDVTKCAQYHLDKHCVKMILESTQLLNNALITHSPSYGPIYRQTHKNHPASIWTAMSRENFDWLNALARALCEEYTFGMEGFISVKICWNTLEILIIACIFLRVVYFPLSNACPINTKWMMQCNLTATIIEGTKTISLDGLDEANQIGGVND